MSTESFDPPSLEALAALLPGYDFEAFIAQGGMGAVYKARQRSLDRDVAIKILPRELGADPEFRQSFETEAKAMARLNHPNLIAVYDFGDADGMPYIVMEYVNGKSLFHSAHNLAVDPRQAVTIVKGICDGLAHAHENGVIHRDIKPANILLTPKAEPKVGDFGLARPAGAGTTGLLMGTPGYTAPEITRQPDHADHRSDLFALGVILYELLIGRCPPYDVPPTPPSKLVGCDPALDAICAIAMHPTAGMRYSSAEAMSAALNQWLRGDSRVPAAKTTATVARRPAPTTATISRAPGRPPRPAVVQAAPIVVKSRGNSNLLVQAAILAVLIVVTAIAWKKLKGMQDDRAAQEAAYNASKAKQETTPAPAPAKGERPELATPKPQPADPHESSSSDMPDEEVAAVDTPASVEDASASAPAEETRPAPPAQEDAVLPPAVVELESKAKDLLAALDKDCALELTSNAKNLARELDAWLRILNRGDQITWKPHVERLKGLAVNDRVPTRVDSDSGINLSERMAKIADFCARKQQSIDETFDSKATKIRDAYVARLSDAAKSADDALKLAIDRRVQAAADLDRWITGLIGASALVPPDPSTTALAGVWNWRGTDIFTFRPDGTLLRHKNHQEGRWKLDAQGEEGSDFTLSWDDGWTVNITVPPTGRTLTGTNTHGEKIRAKRIDAATLKGASDPFVGVWAWGQNGANYVFDADGTATTIDNSGKWTLDSETKGARTYAIEWHGGKFVDRVTLSEDGQSFEGTNKQGQRLWAKRLFPER